MTKAPTWAVDEVLAVNSHCCAAFGIILCQFIGFLEIKGDDFSGRESKKRVLEDCVPNS